MSFDALAAHYTWMEAVLAGRKLQRCRTAFLDRIPSPRSILLLGEGHGRSLLECCRRFRGASITVVDSSSRMHATARAQLGKLDLERGPVDFVCNDALNWTPPSGAFDLVVTNFFLDCFRRDQLERLIPRIAVGLADGANWLIADFQAPSTGWRRVRAQGILWLMYRFFRVATRLEARNLTPPDPYLVQAGLRLHCREQSEWGLLRSDWWVYGKRLKR